MQRTERPVCLQRGNVSRIKCHFTREGQGSVATAYGIVENGRGQDGCRTSRTKYSPDAIDGIDICLDGDCKSWPKKRTCHRMRFQLRDQ
jgi:hypothetical protein